MAFRMILRVRLACYRHNFVYCDHQPRINHCNPAIFQLEDGPVFGLALTAARQAVAFDPVDACGACNSQRLRAKSRTSQQAEPLTHPSMRLGSDLQRDALVSAR